MPWPGKVQAEISRFKQAPTNGAELMDTSITANDIGSRRLSRVHRLVCGRRIGYAEYGDPAGAPVLALHGTPGSRLMFSLSEDLARERRLCMIALDRPGYGLSDYCRYETLRQSADGHCQSKLA